MVAPFIIIYMIVFFVVLGYGAERFDDPICFPIALFWPISGLVWVGATIANMRGYGVKK